MTLLSKLYTGIWEGVDWIFPPSCFNCQAEGERICPDCLADFQEIPLPVCPVCGRAQKSTLVCAQCHHHPPYYDRLRSMFAYQGIAREAVQRLKYQNDLGLAEKLAGLMIPYLDRQNWQFDIIIPLPLFHQRQKERGYNQAALLALPIALNFGVKYLPSALVRVKDTRSQVGLNELERWQNVADAFWAEEHLIKGKNLLLVDDVSTTGATINAAALALRSGGALKIYCLTFARTIKGGAHLNLP